MSASPTPLLPPLVLRPSRRLAALLIAAHAAASGLLLMLPVPAGVLAGTLLLVLVSAGYSIARHALLRGRRAITTLVFSDREQVSVGYRDGTRHAGRILGSSTVGATLTVLNIALEARRLPRHVVLLGDSLDAVDFRRLRVWLRWGPRSGGAEPAIE